MKINLLITFLFFLFASNLCGQTKDTTQVKQITYEPNADKKETVRVSEQQMKAKPFYDQGYSFVDNYQFAKAIDAYKKAIEIDSTGNCGTGTDGIAFGELGYAYARLGDFQNAITYLDKAILLNKFAPDPYQTKSVLLMQQGKNDLALPVLDSLIEFVPDYAMGYVQRGFLYNSTGEYKLALHDLNKYLELIKQQNQEQNSAALVADVKKQIAEIEAKIKN
jgi:tetratricopeptide (TPR) repeat protein